jgi:hypothetical protein
MTDAAEAQRTPQWIQSRIATVPKDCGDAHRDGRRVEFLNMKVHTGRERGPPEGAATNVPAAREKDQV